MPPPASHRAQRGTPCLASAVAGELDLGPAAAAKVAESFVFETVCSDRAGDKLAFLHEANEAGSTVVLRFIGISGPDISEERVAMRVSQGGHGVPTDTLVARYPRTLANLETAVATLPRVMIFDNDDLRTSFRRVAVFERGRLVFRGNPLPKWLRSFL